MGFSSHYIKKYNIFLGSRSPRRKQLLEGLGLNFKIWLKEELPELYPTGLKSNEIAKFLAKDKAQAFVKDLKENDLLITADTIVCYKDSILMKPESNTDAYNSLKKRSGNTHTVITGVCLSSPGKCSCFYSETLVKFAVLSDEEIEFYIDTCAPFDKAGSYGIQEWIGYIGVESINGSYFNVMGLPVQKLYSELKKFTGYPE